MKTVPSFQSQTVYTALGRGKVLKDLEDGTLLVLLDHGSTVILFAQDVFQPRKVPPCPKKRPQTVS